MNSTGYVSRGRLFICVVVVVFVGVGVVRVSCVGTIVRPSPVGQGAVNGPDERRRTRFATAILEQATYRTEPTADRCHLF